ncbi:unnamed protein product [Adineta steineri]|uniref:G-protein coupled receptors family 1 profile domain-containing protein n=1 Tax=Adineta steineri TaxID=433720 RepID=A0A818SXJ9_9BILA|nr:unnamed protein product [Adineta steineri]
MLVLASIDRLLLSSENVETRLYSSRRLAYFSLSVSTCFWLIFFVHVLIEFNIEQVGPFLFICLFYSNGFYSIFLSNSTTIFNLLLFVLMIILSIFSFKNVRQNRLIPRQQRRTFRSMHKKDLELLRCLYFQDLIYLLTSILLIFHTIYGTIINNQIHTSSIQAFKNFLLNLGVFIHHIPFSINFFIYLTISKAFRHEFKRLIYRICGIQLRRIQGEEENIQQNNVEMNVVSISVVPI